MREMPPSKSKFPRVAIVGAVLAASALILLTMMKSTLASKKAAEDAWTASNEWAQKAKDAFKEAGRKQAEDYIAKQERIVRLTDSQSKAEIDLLVQQGERIKTQSDRIKSQEELAIASIKYLEATGQITDAEKRIAEVQRESRKAQRDVAEAYIMASENPAEMRAKTVPSGIQENRDEQQQVNEKMNMLQEK